MTKGYDRMDLPRYDKLCFGPKNAMTRAASSLAVIEQPVNRHHPFFAENIKSYHASPRNRLSAVSPQMHPSVTLSFMVGHSRKFPWAGLAPNADVHFFEINFFLPEDQIKAQSREEKRDVETKEKILLLEETLRSLQNVKAEITKGAPYDAVVYFIGTDVDAARSDIPARALDAIKGIRDAVSDIETQNNIAVFHPSETGFFFRGTNEFGRTFRYDAASQEPVWDQEIPDGAVGIPINNRIVASHRNNRLYRLRKYPGICWLNAILAGGFALCRQAQPTLTKEHYYHLLKRTARVVDYGKGRTTRTVCFHAALKTLTS